MVVSVSSHFPFYLFFCGNFDFVLFFLFCFLEFHDNPSKYVHKENHPFWSAK